MKSVPQENLPVAQVNLPEVELQVCKSAPKKLVVLAVVLKRLVEVAEVPVPLVKVKFCKVLEPETKRSPEVLILVVALPPILSSLPESLAPKRLVEVPDVPVKVEREVSPLSTESVPVKEAALEIVWLFTRPEVIAPKVALPAFKAVAKRLVEEAVVEKKFVVVALVEVEFKAVKFCKVEEAVVRKPPVDSTWKRAVLAALRNFKKLPVKEVVEEATTRSPVVEVAFTWK